jgi:membrane protein YqaA with SNARE-associated domain
MLKYWHKMNNIVAPEKPTAAARQNWLRRNYVSLLVLLFVIAIVIGIFIFYRLYPEKVHQFENYGYLGAFLVCLITNATIILPAPGHFLLLPLGAVLNPALVGLAGGIGGGIGEMSCYLLGYSGRGLIENRQFYDDAVRWLKRWGSLTVFVFALTPLPFDVIGIASGALRFSLWKFFIACFLGKTLLYIAMAWTGKLGWQLFASGVGIRSPLSAISLSVLAVMALLALALFLENWFWKRKR